MALSISSAVLNGWVACKRINISYCSFLFSNSPTACITASMVFEVSDANSPGLKKGTSAPYFIATSAIS